MTGIVIGRFQTPYLHVGHLHLIATALRECDKVVILLGSKKEIDEKNPYSISQRLDLIGKIFPQVYIHVLYDNASDKAWSKSVDLLAAIYKDSILYHSRDSFKDYYSGKLPLKEVEEIVGYSGTKLREEGYRPNFCTE